MCKGSFYCIDSTVAKEPEEDMPVLDLKTYVRIVAGVFTMSAMTAFVMAMLRLLHPELFYLEALEGSDLAVHYCVSGLMAGASLVGVGNSGVALVRGGGSARAVTAWLLLDSLFETSRVVYVFVCEVLLAGRGPVHLYELLVSAAQYLLDSFFYCQMILRH